MSPEFNEYCDRIENKAFEIYDEAEERLVFNMEQSIELLAEAIIEGVKIAAERKISDLFAHNAKASAYAMATSIFEDGEEMRISAPRLSEALHAAAYRGAMMVEASVLRVTA